MVLKCPYIAYYHDDENVKRLIPQALFFLANDCYAAGEWLSFVQIAALALGTHKTYDVNPLEIEEHEELQRTFAHLAILRTATRRLDPVLAEKIDEVFAQWPIDPATRTGLEDLAKDALSDWQTMPVDSLWPPAQKQLSGRPFSDLGKRRAISWKALGIDWSVQFENDHLDMTISEELVSTLQIILADLASEDLCLLPTKVEILSGITNSDKFSIKEEPSNEVARWTVDFPRGWITNTEHLDDLRRSVFSIATVLLGQCSVLSAETFMAKIKAASSQGLALKIFAVRPYSQLYVQFMTQNVFDAIDRKTLCPLEPQREFCVTEHKELGWIDGPGPGYSLKKAHKFLKNRYKFLLRPIRISLPRWLQKEEFKSLIRKLREEGYLDWQILLLISNIAVNHRINARLAPSASWKDDVALTQKLMFKEETEEDLDIPVEIFTQERVGIQKQMTGAVVAKTWGLEIHRTTPDLQALRKLLDVRYNNSKDDIIHEDIFRWGI